MNNTVPNLIEAHSYLEHLDLSYIIDAMCDEAYPLPRWLKQDAEKCAKLYKNFLYLQVKHREIMLVPTREIDEFWHNHILYTKNYFADCMQIFGHYLHHEPANAKDNPAKLVNAFLLTKQLYFSEFNETL